MSNIQRHRLERNGAYLAEDHDGGWVLHSDHAAELARVEDDLLKMNNLAYEWRVRAERAEAYVAGQDVRSDFRNAGEMRAALDAAREECEIKRKHLCEHVADMTVVSMQSLRFEEELRDVQKQNDANRRLLNKALKENTLLRAECEAKQKKIDDARDTFIHIAEYWNGSDNDRAVADALEVMRNAATDAAGILKGAE